MPAASSSRTLIIVLAETRAHELTFDLFKRNFLDPNDADLALCVGANPREDTSNPFYTHAKHVWTYEEPDDWGDAFDHIQQVEGWSGNWRQLLQIPDQWLGGIKHPTYQHPGSGAIQIFFRWYLRRCLIDSGVINHYDRFVVTRSDFMHLIPHVPLKYLPNDHIWLPDGEDWGGYTDRELIANRRHLLKVLSYMDDMLRDPDAFYKRLKNRKKWACEHIYWLQLKRARLGHLIRRYPYTMYTVRAKDGATRWAGGDYDAALGYAVKYPTEHACSARCKRLLWPTGRWNRLNLWLYNRLYRRPD
ncbi:hypothetical protein [Aliiroseovarius sp.]|uniref:hypothetical protein n=1 Tax=Aliiroseovarius sp. TaxID=1872442 RepID=UPI003BAA4063